MKIPAVDGSDKVGSLDPGQDTKGLQSQTMAKMRYSEKRAGLGKYNIRIESSSRTSPAGMDLELRQRYDMRARNQFRSLGVKYENIGKKSWQRIKGMNEGLMLIHFGD